MNPKSLQRMSRRQLVTLGAMSMAAHLFPNRADDNGYRFAAAVRDAHFLMSGHLHLWEEYGRLDEDQRRRITQLLRYRAGRLAILATFQNTVTDLLTSSRKPDGFALLSPELFVVTPETRLELESLVDGVLNELNRRTQDSEDSQRMEVAREGHFRVNTFIPDPTSPGNGVVQAHYVLNLIDLPDSQPLPDFGTPATLDQLKVPIVELGTIADKLDAAFSQQHRRDSLDRLMRHIRTADGRQLQNGMLTIDAGLIRVLSACTGSGKSVLATLLAEWGVAHGLVTSIVVPRNDTVMAFTTRLRAELTVLGHAAKVIPLISPNSMQEEAERAAATHTEAGRHDAAAEVFHEYAYGCPLQAMSPNIEEVDLWMPGQEPCTTIQGTDARTGTAKRFRCPWHGHCGKHRLQTTLADADIIVTSHINLMTGRIRVPVIADSVVRHTMSVEEALLRLSHVLLVDEVDAFQATGFSKSAHHVTLARYGGRRQSALQELDEQFSSREGQLMYELERYIHPKIIQARFLSESYVSNAAHARIAQGGPHDRNRQQLSRRRLILPRRWDAWCTGHLWRLPEDTTPTAEQIRTFRLLFNPRDEASIADQHEVPDIAGVADSRGLLSSLRQALLDTTILKDGQDPIFAGAHTSIEAAVKPMLADTTTVADRTLLVDLLVRRAYLEQVRAQVEYMTRSGTSLKASGITAANELVAMLDDNKQWRLAPYGPLGAPVFGFTAAHDVEDKYRSELALTSFTGDPHAYTATLGEATAMALCGTRRIVVGLSATAYMPGGTMHHLITPPTWYVPDDITGTVSLRPLTLTDEKHDPIRISGSSDIRRDMAHQKMGRALWSHLTQHLGKLSSRPETAHRARILVAGTSYLGVSQLAEGMISAGADPDLIAVAVRAEDDNSVPEHYRRKPVWAEIPSTALERFPDHPTAKLLIAPLAVAERGLNMVDGRGRSLVGQVVLAVRPIPLMDEPAQLLALISSHAYSTSEPTDDPAAMLKQLAWTSTGVYEELFRTHHYFQSLPSRVRLSIVAEMLIGIIQLGGRVRRGGDRGALYLADYAFHDPATGSDLPRLIRDLRDQWRDAGQLPLLSNIYGNTLNAIFDFADEGQTR